MSFNLLDTVKRFLTPNVVTGAASALGESEGGIQKALSGAIPVILAGLLGRAEQQGNATSILDLAKQTAGTGVLNNPGSLLNTETGNTGRGAELVKGIFGEKAAGIISLLSNFAGIKPASASTLLSMGTPVALGAIGQHAIANNLDSGRLMDLLSEQKTSILGALPSGFAAAAGLTGGSTLGNSLYTSHDGHSGTHHAGVAEDKNTSSLKFLMPLLLGILTVALCIYLFKGCSGRAKGEADATDTSAMVATEPAAVPVAATGIREMLKVKLPNDTVLNAYKGGIEDKLVTFLRTDYKKLGADSLKKTWFDFDNLTFKTGSAEITPESEEQVNNLAAILKAFPSVTLKIGGYTDKTGDEAGNKKLSDARAKAVQAALGNAGVGKQLTGAEGYGSSFAVFAADAPETDRVKDRHVSVSVR